MVVHGSMRYSVNRHMLDTLDRRVLTQLSSSLYLPQLPSADNGNNVDWSNSIDLQILTNIPGSSVPSLAVNKALTTRHPRHHYRVITSYRKQQNRLG